MVLIGFTGFIFAGRKLWWAWYINLLVQILWAIYALVTGQLAFLVSAAAYFVIFGINAVKWTKEHLSQKRWIKMLEEGRLYDVGSLHPTIYKPGSEDDGMIIHNVKLDGTPAYTVPGDDSALVEHARKELERIGEEPEVIDWYLRIIREYASFGHSGGSASATAVVLEELLRFRPLTPPTNDPSEWIKHSPDSWDGKNPIWQNTRDGRAFSTDGGDTYTLVDDYKDEDGNQQVYTSERMDTRADVSK